ncbi:MAG TPA: ABC transporter substrate-binding protein [Verrucomicrobiae bacterium]|nr:ABC transporter substrate-binding protein [Verrucomicrobiae bacterium]
MRLSIPAGRLAAGTALAALALAACGQVVGPSARQVRLSSSQTVTFAGYPGEGPSYLFPLYSSAYWDVGYIPWYSSILWRPLYLWGQNGKAEFSAQHSLAAAPVFSTNAAGDTVATITLKNWRWSDGQPLTSRDVEFWMNLIKAEKANWAPYVPGKFPDNVTKVAYPSARTFVVTFNRQYNTLWLLGNELTQITPIPQHAWDKESASGSVGNYDRTPAGARKVYTYLIGQAKQPSTFASNPLWKVVSGAWEISSFSPATDYVTFRPNPHYSGTHKPRYKQFVEVPFTSDAAEFNALEAGQLDYGYVPLNDLSTIPALKRKGYKIEYWAQDTMGGLLLNYAPKNVGLPIVRQLYVRQALTHLVDMSAIERVFEHGTGSYAAGPIPNPGGTNPEVTAYARHDPYPFSVKAAKSLLSSHGWKVVPNGTTTCAHPGTTPTTCGLGVRKGMPLQLSFVTNESTALNSGVTQLLKSDFSLAGIQLLIKSVPAAQIQAQTSSCAWPSKTCSWQMEYFLEFWPLGWPGFLGAFSAPFGCNSNMWWCNPETQRLINAVHDSSSPSALAAFENYIAKEQPMIFLPIPVYRVSAVRKNLQGTAPQDPYLDLYPQDWYYSK